jgi:Ni,Fe-hydrogenase III large subunit
MVRVLEIGQSVRLVRKWIHLGIPSASVMTTPNPLTPGMACVVLVEGWRGEISHMVFTDSAGDIAFYKIVDPSFHNWFGLALAVRGNGISDFPICNKSFDLSYCGHDL